mmetsp:Transcript_46485/g.53890  ORF Transcript_46485/g.53890 Transcript_46485/m.53890 type:complete len:234 (+) Transcript_46485:138-839(+)
MWGDDSDNDTFGEEASWGFEQSAATSSTYATEADKLEFNQPLQKICRICYMVDESASNRIIIPCRCFDPSPYVHEDCLKENILQTFKKTEFPDCCKFCQDPYQIIILNEDQISSAIWESIVRWSTLIFVLAIHFCVSLGAVILSFKIFAMIVQYLLSKCMEQKTLGEEQVASYVAGVICIYIIIPLAFIMQNLYSKLSKPNIYRYMKILDNTIEIEEDPQLLKKLSQLAKYFK